MNNRIKRLLLIGLLVLLSACTATIYGVPQDQWGGLSEAERLQAMEIYRERQQQYAQERADRARIRAEERARLERDRPQVVIIDRHGDAGNHGRQDRVRTDHRQTADHRMKKSDMIRVRVDEFIDKRGNRVRLDTLALTLRDKESLVVTVPMGRELANYCISYRNNCLRIEDADTPSNHQISKKNGKWKKGESYLVKSGKRKSEGQLKIMVSIV